MTQPPYGPPPGGPYGPYGQQPPGFPPQGPPPGFPPPGFPPQGQPPGYPPQGFPPGYPPPGFPPPMAVAPPPMVMRMPPAPPVGPPTLPPWHHQPSPFRPRRSNTGMIVTLSLVGVLVVTAGLIVALSMTSKKHQQTVADSGYDNNPTTSSSPFTTTSETATSTTSATSSTASSTSSTSSRTTSSTSTSSTPSGPKPVHKTKDNPLFLGDQGTNTNTCTLPKWKSDPQSAQAFFKAALPCLEAEWKPVLSRAGLPYFSPNLAFPTGAKWSSACGSSDSSDTAAFYCSGDNTLYMPFEGLRTQQSGAHPGVYLAVFAHEFGHHVQAVSGVMDASWDAEYEAGPDSAAGLELNRRMEMQAQCFGGMWFAGAWNGKGSIDDNIVNEMLKDGYTRGDDNDPSAPRTHGTRAHYGAWQQQGYTKNRTFQCNTYNVGSDAVG